MPLNQNQLEAFEITYDAATQAINKWGARNGLLEELAKRGLGIHTVFDIDWDEMKKMENGDKVMKDLRNLMSNVVSLKSPEQIAQFITVMDAINMLFKIDESATNETQS